MDLWIVLNGYKFYCNILDYNRVLEDMKKYSVDGEFVTSIDYHTYSNSEFSLDLPTFRVERTYENETYYVVDVSNYGEIMVRYDNDKPLQSIKIIIKDEVNGDSEVDILSLINVSNSIIGENRRYYRREVYSNRDIGVSVMYTLGRKNEQSIIKVYLNLSLYGKKAVFLK